MKRFLAALVALILVFVSAATGFAEGKEHITLYGEQNYEEDMSSGADPDTGESFVCWHLYMKLENLSSIMGIQYQLRWDSELLTCTKVVQGQGVNGTLNTSNLSAGRVNYVAASSSSLAYSSTCILTLYFRIAEGVTEGTVIPISFAPDPNTVEGDAGFLLVVTTQSNQNGYKRGDEELDAYDGYIVVGESPVVVRGDVDLNGSVNSTDAAMILRYLVGLETLSRRALMNADTDGSNTIMANDASRILRYLVGLEDSL